MEKTKAEDLTSASPSLQRAGSTAVTEMLEFELHVEAGVMEALADAVVEELVAAEITAKRRAVK